MPSCDSFYKELVDCLLKSNCVLIQRHTPKECLDRRYDEDSVSKECRLVQRGWAECKAKMVNPRMRFRTPYGGFRSKEKEEEEQ
ncbi:hypothetical protein HK104_000174 [Borealophlyctis nickersoniae]|nr:hypothetical protein HK104_000174 [Borealophlyctis nickersoniae]